MKINDSRRAGIKILQEKYDTISAKIKRLYNLYAENEDKLPSGLLKPGLRFDLVALQRLAGFEDVGCCIKLTGGCNVQKAQRFSRRQLG